MHNTLILRNLCKYCNKEYIVKNYILWPTFPPQKELVYLQSLSHNPSEFDETTVQLVITPFKVI